MAVTHRFPALVWQDHHGTYTARLVDRDEPAGVGPSAGAALHQLEDYLRWCFQQSPDLAGPDFLDAQLAQFKVPVRPEYQVDHRRYPCDEPVLLRVYGVHGRQEQGLLVCALPTLELRFYYHDAQALRGLVTHYVQQRLEGLTPRDLARHLPPASAALHLVPITVRPRAGGGNSEDSAPTALRSVADPLGGPQARRQYHRPWLRDAQVRDLVRRLGQEKANVLLLGEPGSGKTTVLVEAVRQLERGGDGGEEPQRARPARRYWQTSAGRLLAGMKYLGQWEARCEEVIAELGQIGGTLCVENLLDLVREGGDAPADSLAAFLLPYAQRGELRLVGEATPAELDACRRLLPGFAEVFQVLALPAFRRAEAVQVLDHLTAALKQNHHVEVGRGVVDLVDQLFRRFMPYGTFPGPVVRFLTKVFEQARQDRRAEVSTEQVLEQFIRQTGLPELFLRDELPLARDEVLATFSRQIIGQDEACQAAADLVVTFKAGLNDPGRPAGVLLFCGPTGVGKTETAKALARYFFGHGDQGERLVRLDMSEYTGFDAGERLLARPDGRPSELIEKLRQQPFALVLLDEIEKADPEVFDVLMGAFDEGRLTDRFGRVTTFRSAVIVMTSNLGSDRQETFGFAKPAGVAYESEALRFFRPEFFNRIDGVVTFQPLSPQVVRDITRGELAKLAQREGLARAGVRLEWTERLVEHLARAGFDARYGARPLQRTVEALVVTPLARYLLERPAVRDATVKLDLGPDGVVISA
jgi:ATP-dependent Clp protease ATP-binding subunit ClpC